MLPGNPGRRARTTSQQVTTRLVADQGPEAVCRLLLFPAVGRALFFWPVFARALPFPIFFEGSLRAARSSESTLSASAGRHAFSPPISTQPSSPRSFQAERSAVVRLVEPGKWSRIRATDRGEQGPGRGSRQLSWRRRAVRAAADGQDSGYRAAFLRAAFLPAVFLPRVFLVAAFLRDAFLVAVFLRLAMT